MIIKNPEQHMAVLLNKLPDNNPARLNQDQGNAFELIMNNKPATVPDSAVPVMTKTSLPEKILFKNYNTKNQFSGQSVPQDNKEQLTSSGGSSIRKSISPDTPRIAANEVRQKIDFGAVRTAPKDAIIPDSSAGKETQQVLPGLSALQSNSSFSPADHLSDNKGRATGFRAVSIQTSALPTQTNNHVQTAHNRKGNDHLSDKLLSEVAPFREHEINSADRQKTGAYKEHAAYKTAHESLNTASVDREKIQPGLLAAKFESANSSGAIGHDKRGGTCYGIYQLSSRRGTMGEFLEFLDKRAPEISSRLRQAGPADSGGKEGDMPREWKNISDEHPMLFADLQHEFIYSKFYVPAAKGVKSRTGLEMEKASPALREVLWSTAVQHGVHGAGNIFQKAMDSIDLKNSNPADKEIIQAVYNERRTRFTGSTQAVQAAVQNRFNQEMKMALAMLPGSADTQA